MDNVVKKGSILPKNDEPRDAFYMGLGDTVIPGLLAVSASLYLPQSASFLMTANLWAAAGAMIGGLLGYLVLFRYVLRGRPQAGLPFLDTGAIAGYLIVYALAYGEIGLGMLGLS